MSQQQMMQMLMEESAYLPLPDISLAVSELGEPERNEVLGFLAERPIHTVILAGLIRDNGLVSRLNRGVFYACRDAYGRLSGVALIGHVTMIETHSSAALECFAQIAQRHQPAHVILGEQEKVRRFWSRLHLRIT